MAQPDHEEIAGGKVRLTRNKLNLFARPNVSLAVFALVVALDQATKAIALGLMGDRVFSGIIRTDVAHRLVGDFIWLFVAYNPGAAFNIAPQNILPFLPPTIFFAILVVLAGFFLTKLWIARRHPMVRLAVVLVMGGAVGNFIDRVRIGHVVDFISVGIPGITWRWPTFNIADSAICLGTVLLAWGEYNIARVRDHREARRVPAPAIDQLGPDDAVVEARAAETTPSGPMAGARPK